MGAALYRAASVASASIYAFSGMCAAATIWIPTLRQGYVGGLAMVLAFAIGLPSTAFAYFWGKRRRPGNRRVLLSNVGNKLVAEHWDRQPLLSKATYAGMFALGLSTAACGIWMLGASFNTSSLPGLSVAMVVVTAVSFQNSAIAASRASQEQLDR